MGTVNISTPLDHLPVRMQLSVPLSDDELMQFCSDNSDLRIEQTAQGELIIMPPAGGKTANRNLELVGQLRNWLKQDGSGVGFDSSGGFKLPNGATRSPDASWVKNERWDALNDEQQEKFAPLCPDFVVELRSPSDTLRDVQGKLEEYIDCGAVLGWLIDPKAKRVHVYRPGMPNEILDNPTQVSGDPELPGFVLDLSEIW